jgi:hypothetical protein
VFTRAEGTIRHFWGHERGPGTADPGQDPHEAPDLSPLWTILDTTPEGARKRLTAPSPGADRRPAAPAVRPPAAAPRGGGSNTALSVRQVDTAGSDTEGTCKKERFR